MTSDIQNFYIIEKYAFNVEVGFKDPPRQIVVQKGENDSAVAA